MVRAAVAARGICDRALNRLDPGGPVVNEQAKTPEVGNGPSGVSALSGGALPSSLPDLSEIVKPLGAFVTEDHRYYWNGLGPKPSVTTILRVINRPGINVWNEQQAVRALLWALREGWLAEFDLNDEYALIEWARAQPRQMMEEAGALGTGVHLLADMAGRAESPGEGFEMPEGALPYLEAFRGFLGFLEAQGGRIVSSEHAVFSSEGYGGTYDLILELDAKLWLVDVKTSRGYYPEYGLQLAGYGYAEWIGLPGNPAPYPMPHIQRYGILHLRPDAYSGPASKGWRLVEYPITDRDYSTFLAALDIYQWNKEGRFTKSILNKAIYTGNGKTE